MDDEVGLSNAIKFTTKNKNITLQVFYEDKKLHIEVIDEGIGIASEKKEKIFEAFSQANISTTRKYGGTGLGLSISTKLVSLMGGKLNVQSKLNEGSTFSFALPLSKGELLIKEEIQPKLDSLKNKKVLLVEDNKSNQMFMKIVLKKLQMQTEIANDGFEAIEMFEKNFYDVILMDENMPNMSGIEATKKILLIQKQRKQKPTPIIALTANALKGDRQRFLNAGMSEYLTKPINKDKLQKTINEVIKKDSN